MLTVTMSCTRCQREFPVSLDTYRALDIQSLPKRCPTCCDELQDRPDVVLERATLAEFTCRVHRSFAGLFQRATPFQPLPTDKVSHRLTVKGRDYGVEWSGRIDLFSHVWPVTEGDVVVVSHNLTKRRVWYASRQRQIAGMVAPGSARTVTTTRRVPKDYQPQEYLYHGETLREEVGERVEDNEAVVLTMTAGSTAAALHTASVPGNNGSGREALPILCWVEAYSKTTLKGLGAQFGRRIEGKPLWHLDVHGHCRSGRYGTHAMLAVVDPADPLTVVGWGDLAEERVGMP